MKQLILIVAVLLSLHPLTAAPRVVWADRVLEVSSEHSETAWSAQQVLGVPSAMPQGGDNPTSWAPQLDEHIQFIKVGFGESLAIRQVIVAENYNPGAIMNVFVYDEAGKEYLIKSFTPEQDAPSHRMLSITLPLTDYNVVAVKLELNSGAVRGRNTIDAIGISDSEEPYKPRVRLSERVGWYQSPVRLPETVNSKANDMKPFITADGSRLYFTRNLHPDNMGGVSDREDIWYSDYDSLTNTWMPAINPGAPLNNLAANSIASALPDNNLLLVNSVYVAGDEYNPDRTLPGASLTFRENGNWVYPRKIDITNDYNRFEREDHCLSFTGQMMIMSVERDDTKGMRDLYICFLQPDGAWSEPQNLGPDVNTAGHEASPFLASDNRTLFFSSNGYPSYGLADIYVSRRIGDGWNRWTKPENIGPLINTDLNDTYFTLTASGDRAFFSRRTDDQTFEDIYTVKMSDGHHPAPAAFVRGRVVNKATGAPVQATVMCEELTTGRRVSLAISDAETGEYAMVLPGGTDYGIVCAVPDFLATGRNINLRGLKQYRELERDLYIIPDEIGQVVFLNNVFFDPKGAQLHEESRPELDRIVTYLKENPKTEIIITGHIEDSLNMPDKEALSLARARSVGSYLREQGIRRSRFEEKGYTDRISSNRQLDTASARVNGLVDILIIRK